MSDEIKNKKQKIEEIYKLYLEELEDLQAKQFNVIKKFIKDLENRKIEEVRNNLFNK